ESIANSTPVLSAFDSIRSNTRLLRLLANQRVFRSGMVARPFLHFTVRAHRYATAGFASHRGHSGSPSHVLPGPFGLFFPWNSLFRLSISGVPSLLNGTTFVGRVLKGLPPSFNAWKSA